MNMMANNFHRNPDPLKRCCKITKPLGTLRYEVVANNGHTIVVDSDIVWPLGVFVTVVDGRIVGKASRFTCPRTCEV